MGQLIALRKKFFVQKLSFFLTLLLNKNQINIQQATQTSSKNVENILHPYILKPRRNDSVQTGKQHKYSKLMYSKQLFTSTSLVVFTTIYTAVIEKNVTTHSVTHNVVPISVKGKRCKPTRVTMFFFMMAVQSSYSIAYKQTEELYAKYFF